MSYPPPEKLEREREKLFLLDSELIRRLGVPEKTGRIALSALDKNPYSGFPKKQKLWGDRRYWPAVRAWLDRLHRVAALERGERVVPDGKENFAADRQRSIRRAPPRRPVQPDTGNPT